MKFLVSIETFQTVEVDAPTEEAAIENVKVKINYRPTDPTIIRVLNEAVWNEESNSYIVN